MNSYGVWGVCACAGAALAASGAMAGGPATLVFSNDTVSSGLVAMHAPPLTQGLETMAGGGCVGDFNGDGFQDVFFLSGGMAPDRLFINNGDGTFTDRAADWGVAASHRGFAAAAGDYNNDGHLDIYASSVGPVAGMEPGHHKLYRNNGNGTFTNVAAAAGVAFSTTVTADAFGVAFGDYDLDGHLDLAVAGWTGSDGNRLFRNNGDGTFTDVTATALNFPTNTIRGFAPRFFDMNGDRYPELLWVADFTTSKYFINNGDGTFTEATVAAGVGLDSNGMGNAVGDFNLDGLFDWYVASRIALHMEHGSGNMLYMNQGNHVYSEQSVAAGVNFGYWGWGCTAIDFNNDGIEDIVATNGWDPPDFHNNPTRLFINNWDMTFTDRAPECNLIHNGMGRGLATADFDNNGTQDVLIFANQQPLSMYRNNLSGEGCNYLRVFLDTGGAPYVAPDGFGARVVVATGKDVQQRQISTGSVYLTTSEPSAHFGLGAAATIDELRVEWTNGRTTTLTNVAANQTITVRYCLTDINSDGVTSSADLAMLLGAWGIADPLSDLNGAGVAASDLALLLGAWGSCD